MSMWDLTTVATNLNTILRPQIADQLNQHAPTLGAIPKRMGAGKGIYWNVKLVRATNASSYASGADITATGLDTEKAAVLSWKRVGAPFVVAGDAIAAAASSGPEAYVNLLGKSVRDAVRNLGISLGSQLFGDGTGNSSQDLDGLAAAVLNTGTYAGIDRGTYTNFQGNVLANSGSLRSLSVGLLRDADQAIFTASGEMFNLIVMGPALYAKYESLFDTARRYNNPDVYSRADAGVAQLAYKGVPVIRDTHCPANTVYLLNTNHLAFEQLPVVPTADGVPLTVGSEPVVTADGNTGISVAIDMLGQTGDAYKGFVKVYGNVVLERPNTCAVISDVE